jgi:hypothetical protein
MKYESGLHVLANLSCFQWFDAHKNKEQSQGMED